MGTSMKRAASSDPVGSLDHVRPTPAKAGLASDLVGPALCRVIAEAVVDYYGSVKAAAISLNDVDPSLMMREFKEGKFARLDEHADAQAKASIAAAMRQAYDVSDPKARIRRLIREARQRLDELADAVAS